MNVPPLNPRLIQQTIRQLESMDSRAASISDFDLLIATLLRGYEVVTPKFDAGVYIYRGRKCDKLVRLCDISYPPAKLVTAFGRANEIGQPIFYGATARNVPFFELDAQPGDYIALSKWKTTEPMMLNHIGFSSEPESFKHARRKLESIYKFVEE